MKWIVLTGFLVLLGHGEGYASVIDAFPEKKAEGEAIAAAIPITKTANQTCVAKAMFIKDCNICWCNDNGTDYFCTRKVCVPELPDEPAVDTPEEFRVIKKECRPFEVFELDCNMCRCNPDGKSFSCTRRACLDLEDKVEGVEEVKVPLSRKVRGAPEDAPKVCQAGEGFRLDCNTCLCDNEGLSFSCTRIDCNAQSAGSPRAKREDDPNFRCNPGEQYTRDCNDCTCSADGRSVFCTQRLCDETLNGLTP